MYKPSKYIVTGCTGYVSVRVAFKSEKSAISYAKTLEKGEVFNNESKTTIYPERKEA